MPAEQPLRIVDFSTHLSGPLATHLLTELGADVVKVENPKTGDGNRGAFELVDGVAIFHLALNAGARSLAVSRHSPEWPDIIAACARWADAVVVGARPSDAQRRGMDFATMQQANPNLIYCAISGYGDNGPWQDYTAHGQTTDALAGLVDVEEAETQPHTRSGWRTAGTTLAGVFAAMGILSAVHRRDRGLDHAQYVSVSLWQSAMWWSWRDLTTLANIDEPWLDYSDLGSRYSMYRTADRRTVLVAPIEKRFWGPFCDIIGMPAAARSRGDWQQSGMCHGKGPEFDDERQAIADRIATQTLDHWTVLFEQASIPFAPLLTPGEALASEHADVMGVMRETTLAGQTWKIPALPIHFGLDTDTVPEGSPPPLSPPPGIGEHNAEILEELGVTVSAPAASAGH